MLFPLLPKLTKDSKIAFSDAGKWLTGETNRLSSLVDSLEVSDNVNSNISSIPDIWARPILVRDILIDKNHTQHAKYVEEWRGILGILAMRKVRFLRNLSLASVEIPETVRDSDPEFLKVLARSFIPDNYVELEGDSNLNPGIKAKIQIVLYDEKPLAIVWPSILVCPAISLDKYHTRDIELEIPWWRNDGLHDPIPYLSVDEKNSFYKWLQNLFSECVIDNSVAKELQDFEDALKSSLGKDYKEVKLPISNSITLGITGACQYLDKPIGSIECDDFLEKSYIRLIKQRGDENLDDILIVSPDLDEQWNIRSNEIIIGGYVSATAYLHKGSGHLSADEHIHLGDIDLTKYNAKLQMADEVFTDDIAIFDRGYNAFPNVLGNKVYPYGTQSKINIVLPIRSWVLKYLTPEYIVEHTTIEIIEKDINVTFSIPVKGPDKKYRTIITSKTYKAVYDGEYAKKKSDIVRYSNALPLIQVWPNIKLREPNTWNEYYTYFDTGLYRSDFHVVPVYQNHEFKPERVTDTQDTQAEIAKCTHFPEAFICRKYYKGELSEKIKEEEIGLLLLNQNNVEEISTQISTCKIGIDFGTTNTTAYMKPEGGAASVIHFKNRKYYVTLTENAESISGYDRASVRKNFISENEQPNNNQSSIKTMYHANPEKRTAVPFFSGNIYYIDQSNNIQQDMAIMSHIKTNDMKWDQEKGAVYMQGFLMQLCLQCMVEAIDTGANTIEWMYSYPKSFSLSQRDQYERTWTQTIYNEIKSACSLTSGIPMNLTESESVAEYFKAKGHAAMIKGFVCLDIGGGSTDIAVWQESEKIENGLLNQTSIRFAGGDIFADHVFNRKINGHNVFAKLENDNKDFNKLLKYLTNEINEHKFKLQLEALLRDYEEDIFQLLPAKRNDSEVALLIRDVSFAIGGIFFYTGMLVGYLRKNGKYNRKESFPEYYVGGNASKLLNWSAAGKFSTSSIAATVFSKCAETGASLIDPPETNETIIRKIRINMTDHPKQEVAYGLVVGTQKQQEDENIDIFDDKDIAILSGEPFAIDEERSDSQIVKSSDFLKTLRIDRRNPVVFKEYLAIFNRMMKKLKFKEIQFSDSDLVDICTKVNQDLSDIRKRADGDRDNVSPEPMFILVLKEAYKYLAVHPEM